MPLKDLVVYLWNRQVTGVLSIERSNTKKRVVVNKGFVVNASSNLPREYLGQFLINLGHITEDQFQRAFQTQKETKVFLGRILVMIGLVSEEIVMAALNSKFRETLLEAFDWNDEGSFSFEPGPGEAAQTEGLDVRVSLLDIHGESDFRIQAWKQIREAFPSGSCTLELLRDNLVDEPKAGSVDADIVTGIEAGLTIDELQIGLHATDYFLYQRLYAMHRLGAVRVRTRPPSAVFTVGADNVGLEALLVNARSYLENQNFRDAYAVIRAAQSMGSSSDGAAELRQLEATWMPELRVEYLESERVPEVIARADVVKDAALTAPERYLLSRVDGQRTIGAIVRVAPLREFEALAAFDRFVTMGLVGFKP